MNTFRDFEKDKLCWYQQMQKDGWCKCLLYGTECAFYEDATEEECDDY